MLSDDHSRRGTLVAATLTPAQARQVAHYALEADAEGRAFRLALEIEPDQTDEAAVKVSIGNGAWSLPLAPQGPAKVQIVPLYDLEG